ncbi:MAG TPA: hypothetical protein VFV66_23095, partial [Nonomuraea sp.]|nr:hypothetical protein [Nonomuraea sp.]
GLCMPSVGKVPPPTNFPAPWSMHPILSADRMPHSAHYIGTFKVVQHIADGGLSYGTAMTVAAAQGLTAEHALIYGMGLDPHTLYSAMTRDRETARLYLPRELLETDADRVFHGRVRSEADALQRALAAYAATLDGDRADAFLTPEPDPIALREAEGEETARSVEHAEPARGAEHDQAHARDGGAPEPPAASGRARTDPEAGPGDAERRARAAVGRASALLTLLQSRHGVGLLPETELAARTRDLSEKIAATEVKARTAEQDKDRFARDGGGRAERDLLAKRAQLAEQVRLVEAAASATEQLRQARQDIDQTRRQLEDLRRREQEITRELDTLRPWHRARRHELEAELPRIRDRRARQYEYLDQALEHVSGAEETARQAAEQAPRQVTWPLVRRRHADLERDFDAVRRAARSRDVTDAALRAQEARAAQADLRQELAAVRDEQERRADLPPDRRDIEEAARAEHEQRQRQVDAEQSRSPERGLPPARSPVRRPPQRDHADRAGDVGQ